MSRYLAGVLFQILRHWKISFVFSNCPDHFLEESCTHFFQKWNHCMERLVHCIQLHGGSNNLDPYTFSRSIGVKVALLWKFDYSLTERLKWVTHRIVNDQNCMPLHLKKTFNFSRSCNYRKIETRVVLLSSGKKEGCTHRSCCQN